MNLIDKCVINSSTMGKELEIEATGKTAINSYLKDVVYIKEKFSDLKKVDLIVEGGVGTGELWSLVSLTLFPNSFWVGTNLTLMDSKKRKLNEIPQEDFNVLKNINNEKQWNYDSVSKSTIFGNCFDNQLINEIIHKTGVKYPILTSFNALYALFSRDLGHFEGKKDSRDIVSVRNALTNSPYKAQLHMINRYIWEEPNNNVLTKIFHEFEETAKELEYTTERLSRGILILKNNTSDKH